MPEASLAGTTMHPDGQAPHILVTNHAPEILELMRELLTDEGYRVTVASRGDQTLDSIAAIAPDLIVIDYMWPSSDNEWTLLNLLRMDPRTRSIPCILCTGAVAQVRGMEDHLHSMGIRVVYKPFDIAVLVGEVQTALDEVVPSDRQAAVPDGE
jgi:CheY-like chemotaxis protein